MSLKPSDSIDKFLELYLQSFGEKQQTKMEANLKTTLRKAILPQFGFSEQKSKDISQVLKQITIANFISQAPTYFKSFLAQLPENKRRSNTVRNYESHFYRFIKALNKQELDLTLDEKKLNNSLEINDISERTPKLRAGTTLQAKHRGKRQLSQQPYSLKKEELVQFDKLAQQFEELKNYLTVDYHETRKRDEPCRESSWKLYEENCLRFLGWQKNIQQKSIRDISLSLMTNLETLNLYLKWHSAKGNSVRNALNICNTATKVAICFLGEDSEAIPEIRKILNKFSQKKDKDSCRRTTSKQALAEKLLDYDRCVVVVQYLRNCCAPKTSQGIMRPNSSIIDSWQDYLIIAILTFTPVRQKEIREFKIGENLKREPDGWWVTLTPEEHKTGSKTGKGREYPLFCGQMKEVLTRDLDEYVNKWRKLENLDHNYLFFLPGRSRNPNVRGQPIPDSQRLAQAVPKLMFRVTTILFGEENAKCPSPHDFRRIFVTWFYQFATLAEQQVYAEILGHSPEEAQKTYSQLTSRDKTSKADQAYRDVHIRSQQATSDGKIFLSAYVELEVLQSLALHEKNLLVRLGLLK